MPQFGRLGRVGIASGAVIAIVAPPLLNLAAQAQTTVPSEPREPAVLPPTPDEIVECDLLIVGGGLIGHGSCLPKPPGGAHRLPHRNNRLGGRADFLPGHHRVR